METAICRLRLALDEGIEDVDVNFDELYPDQMLANMPMPIKIGAMTTINRQASFVIADKNMKIPHVTATDVHKAAGKSERQIV